MNKHIALSLETLRCPFCFHSQLEMTAQKELRCEYKNCSRQGHTFLQVSGQPILINFEKSVFQEKDYLETADGSVLKRKVAKAKRILDRFIWGINKKAEENSKLFFFHLLTIHANPTVLIIGGGTIGSGATNLYRHPNINLVAFDVYCSEMTDFVADAHAIPLQDQSVDGVWIQAVLEHVLEPEKVVSEIHRILKPGGIVYAETPFMQQVHEKAYDFTRFTESGHRWLFRNFTLIKSGSVGSAGTVLIWSIRHFFSSLFRNKKLGHLVSYSFFWLRFFDQIMPEDYTSDTASCVFFMGAKSDCAIVPHEIIGFYRGVH